MAAIGAILETALVVSELATIGMALGYGAKKGYDLAKSKKEPKKRYKKSVSVEANPVYDSDLSDEEYEEDDKTKEKKTVEILGVKVYDRESSTENASRTVKMFGLTVYNCKDTTAKNEDKDSKKNV
jgi:hypothetical protein